MVRMQPIIQEYLSIGVEGIWLVDSEKRQAICYSQQNPASALCDVLRTASPEIQISLASVFEAAT